MRFLERKCAILRSKSGVIDIGLLVWHQLHQTSWRLSLPSSSSDYPRYSFNSCNSGDSARFRLREVTFELAGTHRGCCQCPDTYLGSMWVRVDLLLSLIRSSLISSHKNHSSDRNPKNNNASTSFPLTDVGRVLISC